MLVRENSTLGRYLTDNTGRTLYKFARDTKDTSNCNDGCAQAWPPLAAPSTPLTAPSGVTGTLSTITRADGKKQVAYNGVPLYYFANDAQPGETKGQGVGGNWFVVAP